MNAKQIIKEIFWNEQVLRASRDRRQRARCAERLERLRAALVEAEKKEKAQ